jgi:hypothetical protein
MSAKYGIVLKCLFGHGAAKLGLRVSLNVDMELGVIRVSSRKNRHEQG